MSINAKLQVLDAELEQKILDPEFKLENSLGLLQVAAYISTLLNTGAGGGGSTIDYTAYLDSLNTKLNSFYLDETGLSTVTITTLENLQVLLSDFYNQYRDESGNSYGLLSANNNILNNLQILSTALNALVQVIEPKVGTINSNVGTLGTKVDALNSQTLVLTTKSTGIEDQLVNVNAQTVTLNTKSQAITDQLVSLNTKTTALLAATQVNLALTPVAVTINAINNPELLLAADPDRKYLMIQNNSNSGDVTIGFTSNMTALTGMRLPVNAAFEQNSNCIYRGAVYGYKTAGNGTLSIITGVAL